MNMIRYIALLLAFFPALAWGQARVSTAPAPPQYFGQPVFFYNGDVSIDQTTEGAAVSCDFQQATYSEVYVAEQYRIACNTGATPSAGLFTCNRQHSDAPSNTGFNYVLRCDVTTPDAATTAANNYHIEIPVEAPNTQVLAEGTTAAQPYTVQFWAKFPTNITFTISTLVNNTNDWSYRHVLSYTGSGSWQFFSFTFPGTSFGPWNSLSGQMSLKFLIDLGTGSSHEGTADIWQTAGQWRVAGTTRWIATTANWLEMTGFQIDAGGSALPFRFMNPQVQLQLAQRYYFKTFGQGQACAQATSVQLGMAQYMAQSQLAGSFNGINFRFPFVLAGTPTVTTYSVAAATANWSNISTGGASGVATVVNASSTAVFIQNNQLNTDLLYNRMGIHLCADARLGGN